MAHPRLTMYSRRRCRLCDEARAVILDQLGKQDFDFEEIFIDGNQDLELEYGLRVPVVLVNGTEEFETQIEADLLAQALERPLRGED